MDIFVRNVPASCTVKELNEYFEKPLKECGIHIFQADKLRDKPYAVLTVLDARAGCTFLQQHGTSSPFPRAPKPLYWSCKILQFNVSTRTPDKTAMNIRSLEYHAGHTEAKAISTVTKSAQSGKREFQITTLQCGIWDYINHRLSFTPHWESLERGKVVFGAKSILILLGHQAGENHRVMIKHHDCENVVLGESTISFTLCRAPKFYRAGIDLAASMRAMDLDATKSPPKLTRLPSIDGLHAQVAGTSLVYRCTFDVPRVGYTASALLGKTGTGPPIHRLLTVPALPTQDWTETFERLIQGHEQIPFTVRYQLQKLSMAMLSPATVTHLVPKAIQLYNTHGHDATVVGLRRLYFQAPLAGPDTSAADLSTLSLESMLEECVSTYEKHRSDNPYELSKRHQHISLVHKVVVTPAGMYLRGPEPEPSNRVIRRYEEHINHFVRVVFEDEDGSSVRYDPRASNDVIYNRRFKAVLDSGLSIAGRHFSFLGFSNSSLRSQSCWFMAPFSEAGVHLQAANVLRELGDFTHIRTPAKCAARIGQNFTDTNATLDLDPSEVGQLSIVERNGRDFSDGVGTISRDLLHQVHSVYGTRRTLKPSVLQIRFQGAKGMVSLDTRLSGRQLMLRSNMKKFETSSSWNLEICGAAFRPLQMYLNRQIIKILEDLGIDQETFITLQADAVSRLRLMTTSATNASTFLEDAGISKATGMSNLILKLGDIGFDYHHDSFIWKVVELAVISQLRDIKYRARIPLPGGVTLYGIMDETGELREGEVFVVCQETPGAGRTVWKNRPVIVTRSPALHPGDIQLATAVDVSPDSPLHQLTNVVVFSQHGSRDLPSQLSGGDLDGDLYNIIYDPRLIPSTTSLPADYPRLPPAELDRAVTAKDMSDFFVKFMESDLLGMISTRHLQVADQKLAGTVDPDCIKLAGLASTAVDYSKTGIAVNMKELPGHHRQRPDFMSFSPRAFVSEAGFVELENDPAENEDDVFEGLDTERAPYRFYKSDKVLGHLYRAINERQFLTEMHQEHQMAMIHHPGSVDLMQGLLAYVQKLAADYSILHEHHQHFARTIRESYENELLDILYNHAPVSNKPVSEHEAFAGQILGRSSGAQGQTLRELSKAMRERFETIADYTTMRIIKGDREVGELEALDDIYTDREFEALPRAIACLEIAVHEPGLTDHRAGELQSFKYVAAGVCLNELKRYQITTFGAYVLPMA